MRRYFSSAHSLRGSGGRSGLLLDALEEELVGLVGLSGEVLLVGEQLGEVNHGLVDEHTSDSPSEGVSEGGGNDGVDLVTNELFPHIRGGNSPQVFDVEEGKGELSLEHLLGRCLGLNLGSAASVS